MDILYSSQYNDSELTLVAISAAYKMIYSNFAADQYARDLWHLVIEIPV